VLLLLVDAHYERDNIIVHRRIHVLEQIEATAGEFSLSCVRR
jgi:hypothetical protein